MIDTSHYPAEVFWYEPDNGFIAVAPDFPGSSAWGATQAEALAELQNALEAGIEAYLADGRHPAAYAPSPVRLTPGALSMPASAAAARQLASGPLAVW